jgi:hypothetical protein
MKKQPPSIPNGTLGPLELVWHQAPASCEGENCSALDLVDEALVRCGSPARHKLAEEVFEDDPNPYRHELTAYVCCGHFIRIVGPTFAPCVKR